MSTAMVIVVIVGLVTGFERLRRVNERLERIEEKLGLSSVGSEKETGYKVFL